MLNNGVGYHYVLIRDLNRLLGKGSGGDSKIFCPYCCWGFVKKYLKPGQMAERMDRCFKFKGTKIDVPQKGKNIIEFTKLPHIVYMLILKQC